VADFVTRFAPSPTGYLHEGHAFSALTVFEAARAAGGRFLLRIEDIDRERCRPEYDAAILEDLAWLGLSWETPVRRQSEHLGAYTRALAQLRAEGLLYRCFRTRRQVLDEIARAPHGPGEGPDHAVFRGEAVAAEREAALLAEGRPYAWRLSLARARERLGPAYDALSYVNMDAGVVPVTPDAGGDVVLARKGLGVAYHLAAVVDDALQDITHVIRGEDLRDAAPIHRLLQALLGLPAPAYRHHRLLHGPDGKRLAKRNGARSLRALRAGGFSPDDVRRRVLAAD
jgi:glutamyl-Q tRNA(Asp) synthetase